MTWLLLTAFIASLLLTGLFRRYAIEKQILDVPNHRSSHLVPTPRGGGIVFVSIFIVAITVLYVVHIVDLKLLGLLVCPGMLIAALGFIDDKKSISASTRLLIHFGISILVIFCLGGMPPISVVNGVILSGLLVNIFAVFYLVWLTNLYNFMDGIDGIAAMEAIFVCIGGALLYCLTGFPDQAYLLLILAFSVGGFLYWNFPPARLFMGDAGSGFLGVVFGVLSVYAGNVKSEFFWSWLILLGVFIVDATLTLLIRAIDGYSLSEAHCNHAYQHASRYLNSHRIIIFAIFSINVLWLLPLSILVGLSVINGVVGLILAYLPLTMIILFWGAGRPQLNYVLTR